METEEMIRLLASRLIEMSPAQREAAIASLKDWTNFCWECFYDFRDDRRKCFCWNDE